MSEFGIDYSPLSGAINVGKLSRAGTEFVDKHHATNAAVAAVCRYVLAHFPGGMVLRAPDGTGWEIDVTPIESRGAQA